MKKISVSTYREDVYYPRVVRAVEAILAKGQVVAPVDVFVQLDLLSASGLEVALRSSSLLREGHPLQLGESESHPPNPTATCSRSEYAAISDLLQEVGQGPENASPFLQERGSQHRGGLRAAFRDTRSEIEEAGISS